MTRALALLIIGFALGGGLGFVLGVTENGEMNHTVASLPPPMSEMDHSQHMHVHGEPLVLSDDETAPSLEIAVTKDPVSGWNLEVTTTHFVFQAEKAGLEHVQGEGHAHVYVNGEKLARVYGNWFHIETLPHGRNEVEVTLNANDHRAFVVGGVPVSASVIVETHPN